MSARKITRQNMSEAAESQGVNVGRGDFLIVRETGSEPD